MGRLPGCGLCMTIHTNHTRVRRYRSASGFTPNKVACTTRLCPTTRRRESSGTGGRQCRRAPPRPSPTLRSITRAQAIPRAPRAPRADLAQTPVMNDRVIRQRRNHTPTQPLVTHAADSLVTNHDPPVAAALAAGNPVAQQQQRLARHELGLAEASDHAALVDRAVRCADATPEVRLQVADRDGVRDQGEG